MPAQPPPCLTKDLIAGFVRSVPRGIALAAGRRRTSGMACTLRDWWRPAWLRRYRRCKGVGRGQARRRQARRARRARCTALVPIVYGRIAMRRRIVVIGRPDSPSGGIICGAKQFARSESAGHGRFLYPPLTRDKSGYVPVPPYLAIAQRWPPRAADECTEEPGWYGGMLCRSTLANSRASSMETGRVLVLPSFRVGARVTVLAADNVVHGWSFCGEPIL